MCWLFLVGDYRIFVGEFVTAAPFWDLLCCATTPLRLPLLLRPSFCWSVCCWALCGGSALLFCPSRLPLRTGYVVRPLVCCCCGAALCLLLMWLLWCGPLYYCWGAAFAYSLWCFQPCKCGPPCICPDLFFWATTSLKLLFYVRVLSTELLCEGLGDWS